MKIVVKPTKMIYSNSFIVYNIHCIEKFELKVVLQKWSSCKVFNFFYFIICQVTVIAQRQRICLKWMRDRKIDGLQIFVCVKDNVALQFEKLNVP